MSIGNRTPHTLKAVRIALPPEEYERACEAFVADLGRLAAKRYAARFLPAANEPAIVEELRGLRAA